MAKQITITYTNSVTFSVSDEFDNDMLDELGNAVSSHVPSIEDVAGHMTDIGMDVKALELELVDQDFISHEETITNI